MLGGAPKIRRRSGAYGEVGTVDFASGGSLCDSGKPANGDQSRLLSRSSWPGQGGSKDLMVAFGRRSAKSPHCVALRGLDMAVDTVSAGMLVVIIMVVFPVMD